MSETHLSPDKSMWAHHFRISHYFVDPDGLASIHGLAFFLQEAAHHHATARSLGYDDLVKENKAWVLTRQAIKMYEIPKIPDTLRIETWIQETNPLFSVRDFHMINSRQEIIGLARTSWMIIDLLQRKPVKIPDSIIHLIPHHPGRLKENLILDKIPAPESLGEKTNFKVRYSDLDMNIHVNNITYLRWVLDDHDLSVRKGYTLEKLEINYLNEALYGEGLYSQTISTGQANRYITEIRREKDDREILRARSLWKPRINQ